MPEITGCDVVYSTPWFKLLAKTVQGSVSDGTYYALQPSDYVTVLAVTPQQQILLVRQYRPAVETYTLEFPSGNVDPGETPEQSIRRELIEETGYQATDLELLGFLKPDTGRLANNLWCYFAPNVQPHPANLPPEAGIELVLYTPAELGQALREGRLDHALHLAILCLAFIKQKLPMTFLF